MAAPILDIANRPNAAVRAANDKRAVRQERLLRDEVSFKVEHFSQGNLILPHLNHFFAQHIDRWSRTDNPSRFVHPQSRALFENFTLIAADTGWLRFTRIEWKDRAIAYHYGTCYRGRYLWGTSSFAPDLASRSPGQVLIRQLLLKAIGENARIVDLGTGTHQFKLRIATDVHPVRTWGLYPPKRDKKRHCSDIGGYLP